MFKLLIALLLLPLACVWIMPLVSEILALALSGRRKQSVPGSPADGRFLVLVPAHDEELLIGSCVESLRRAAKLIRHGRIVVVADNCSDGTASIARDRGAEVLERRDPERPGKPWALAYALERLGDEAFDAVVIVDADTVVEPTFLVALDAHAGIRERAFQGYFGLRNPNDSWLTILGQVLNLARYEWAFPLKARAGWSVPFTGNGMCLGRGFLARVGWPADSLTENWELYARAIARNERVEFEPKARIASQEVASLTQGATQRKRWLAGRWKVLEDHWRDLLTAPVSFGQRLDGLSELFFPGPVLHGAVGLVLGLGLTTLGGTAGVVGAMFLASLVPAVVWAIVGVLRHESTGRALIALLMLPPYAVWRVTIGVVTWSSTAGRVWLRSPRHAEKNVGP